MNETIQGTAEDRFAQARRLLAAGTLSIQIEREGNLLFMRTGRDALQRSRLSVRIGGLLVVLIGGILLFSMPWAGLLIPGGFLLLILAHLLVRPKTYFAMDVLQGILPGQPATEAPLQVKQIDHIRGAYEVQGWDSQSAFYAVQKDGTEKQLIALPGTNMPLAEALCLVLGCLLQRPSTYADLFGNVKAGYEPAAEPCTPTDLLRKV